MINACLIHVEVLYFLSAHVSERSAPHHWSIRDMDGRSFVAWSLALLILPVYSY